MTRRLWEDALKRREVVAALAAAIIMPSRVCAQAAAGIGTTIDWVVPFQEGGGTDIWARFMSGWLSRMLPGQVHVRLRNVSGGNSTRAANFFAAEARSDRRMLLGTTGSTQFAALLGDRRVQYDYDDWQIVAASPSGGVVYVPASLGITSMEALLERRGPVDFGSIGAASLDIVPLLAFEMLGLDVAVLLGLNSRNAAFAGVVEGELEIDYQTTASYLAQARPLEEAGRLIPLMSLGALDGQGRMGRDPAFPDLPAFAEVYQRIHGRAPAGPAWQVWQALFRAGFAAQKMVFLPRSVPETRAAVFRDAFARMVADPVFRAEAAQVLGPYPLLTGAGAQAALTAAMTLPPETRDWTLDWLNHRFRVTP